MALIDDFNTVINDMASIIQQLKNPALWKDPAMPKQTIERIKKVASKLYALSDARKKVPDFDYASLEVQFTTAHVELDKTPVGDNDRANAVRIIEAVISHLKAVKSKLENA